MTSVSILPSTGPIPPNLRRHQVSESVQQSSPQAGQDLSRSASSYASDVPLPLPASSGEEATPSAKEGVNTQPVRQTSAVLLQVEESKKDTDVSGSQELSEEEEDQLEKLKAREDEVIRHEEAHKRAGGPYASSPSYEYVEGPDGKRYAVGGHVSIDTSVVAGDPQATIDKLEVVRKAALAPAQPSGQDRSVAYTAAAKILEAKAELAREEQEELEELTAGEGQQSQSSEVDSVDTDTSQTSFISPVSAPETSPLTGLNLIA